MGFDWGNLLGKVADGVSKYLDARTAAKQKAEDWPAHRPRYLGDDDWNSDIMLKAWPDGIPKPGTTPVVETLPTPAVNIGSIVDQFGLTDQERFALENTIAKEAFQGGEGKDISAVSANILARSLSGNWGGTNIVDIVTAPGQYTANFPFSRSDIIKENLHNLSASDLERIRKYGFDLSLVGEAFKNSKGAQQFRGQTQLKYKHPEDYMPEERGNFFFDDLPTNSYEQGLKRFGILNTNNPTSPTVQTIGL